MFYVWMCVCPVSIIPKVTISRPQLSSSKSDLSDSTWSHVLKSQQSISQWDLEQYSHNPELMSNRYTLSNVRHPVYAGMAPSINMTAIRQLNNLAMEDKFLYIKSMERNREMELSEISSASGIPYLSHGRIKADLGTNPVNPDSDGDSQLGSTKASSISIEDDLG